MPDWKKLAERLRYEFDKTMAVGPIALIGWLAVVSFAVIVVVGVFLAITGIAPQGSDRLGFVEAAWEALMRTIDSGTLGGDVGWGYRLVMLIVTLWGIFIVSALIGLLSAGVQESLDELRKGRSLVLEKDHVVILNWSPSIFDIVAQLAIAHAKDKKFRVVIMADKDKVEMEDECADKLALPRNTQVICRRGDPTDLSDLEIVNLKAAASVIIISQDGIDPDARNIKTVLALVHGPHQRDTPHRIAVEIRAPHNADVVRSIGNECVQPVLADDLISRIIVHSSRQTGLSAVYSELLDFEGCEFYTLPQPALTGDTFGEALTAYEIGALVGFCGADGKVHLNPPMDEKIAEGALAVLIAEDRDSLKLTENAEIDTDAILPARETPKRVERTLILGWNRRGAVIASELSCYMAPGSVLTIAASAAGFGDAMSTLKLQNADVRVEHHVVDTSNRKALETLDPHSYDHVVVLAYSDAMAPHPADTHTLVTLLHLRHMAETPEHHVTVVSEMADVRNRQLAQVTRADDFVVSNKLVSLMLAQTSENENLSAIFADILDEEGSEIYMRPVEDYVKIDRPLNFFTIVASARARGEAAFGYCRRGSEEEAGERNLGGVVLNPNKAEKITYKPGDTIVVLARD